MVTTEPKGDLDKFLQGIPQNAVLENLRDEVESFEDAPKRDSIGAGFDREFDDDDREHVHRLTLEPGWPLIIGRLDRMIRQQKNATEAMSMEDPLGNEKKVANGWAYVAMMRRVRAELLSEIQSEIEQLRGQRR